MLTHIPFPALPVPPSWFPGHMLQFQKMLPALLNKTDVVLELRDSRLPLTSINRNFEGMSKTFNHCSAVFVCTSMFRDARRGESLLAARGAYFAEQNGERRPN